MTKFYIWDEGCGEAGDDPSIHDVFEARSIDAEYAVGEYMEIREETREGELMVWACTVDNTDDIRKFEVSTELEPSHYVNEIS